MNDDPFDTLRSRNPAPPESLPGAPMTVASRITAGHPSLRRGLAIATAAAAVVLVAGGGWMLWSQTGGRQTVVAPATTLVPGTTTTTLPPVAEEVPELVVYFLRDGALMPVARDLRVLNVRPLPDLGPLAIDLLLWGPGAWDAGPLPEPVAAAEAKLTTAIPEGTTLLGLTIADGIATIDLSADFAAASPQAITQVVYTLTRLEEVTSVAFSIQGVSQVVGSLTSGLFTPYLEPAAASVGMDSVDRGFLSLFLPDVMIENPALGGTLRPGEALALLTAGFDATLTLTATDGTLLWNAWAPQDGEPPYLPPEAIMAAGGYGTWATLRAEATGSDGAVIASTEIPVWLEPTVPFVDEPDIPEATTTSTTGATTTLGLAAGTAPWSAPSLPAAVVPEALVSEWGAAANRDWCPALYPEDIEVAHPDAVPHPDEGAGWGFAWDLPSGPGFGPPEGPNPYCPDCGHRAFGVYGVEAAAADQYARWRNQIRWDDGSRAGYGYSGDELPESGAPLGAYLVIPGRGCLYNVWSFLGEEHLLDLLARLRFVDGLGGFALGDLRPFPDETLTGCAAGTVRDLAAFEAALANGPITLEDLCALVGMPDYETGSGLFIPAYDLADGSRLFLGYTGPNAGDLIYANLVSPEGEMRNLLDQ